RLAGERWDSAVGMALGRRSVAQWLDVIDAPEQLRSRMRGFRGFFLADPEDLSLLPLVEQFADWDAPGRDAMYRIDGGNDRLATVVAKRLRGRVLLRTIARRVAQHAQGVRLTIEDAGGTRREIAAAFVVCALPASTMRDVVFDPPLPQAQHDAFAHLRYGCATRLLLQFARRFWRGLAHPRAYGTDLPVGAFWDGNEQQPGPRGILSFLAGGGASRALQELRAVGGDAAVVRQIAWVGAPAPVTASQAIVWEQDPWAKGGYAYFDPGFDPLWRAWLARPAGRIVFAGEHTSVKYQGYMNGAIESGLRAAAEIAAMTS
ncbi:MAG TPA: NAD(P)/FAD-dependent oxidoreductase, partial [Vicinamibacterales bacterium]